MFDREGAKTDVVELIGWMGGLDMATEQPNKLVRTEGWGFGNMVIVVLGLMLLHKFEIHVKFIVDTREVLLKVGSGRNIDWNG